MTPEEIAAIRADLERLAPDSQWRKLIPSLLAPLTEIERLRFLVEKADYAIATTQQVLKNPNIQGMMAAQVLLEDWQKAYKEESGNDA